MAVAEWLPRLSPASPIGDPKSPGQDSAINDSDGRLTTHERRSRLISAICEKGLYNAVAELENQQPTTDLAYRSWELTRLGGRAEELVGTVVGPDGRQIPWTAFEPYFVGLPAEEIVRREIALGHRVAIDLKLEHPKGRTIEISEREREVINALRGEKISYTHVIQVLKDLDCAFKVAHCMAESSLTPEGELFRDRTHDIVESMIRSGKPYVAVARDAVVRVERQEDVDVLVLLGRIGIIGYPDLREIAAEKTIEDSTRIERTPYEEGDDLTHRRLVAVAHTRESTPPDEYA